MKSTSDLYISQPCVELRKLNPLLGVCCVDTDLLLCRKEMQTMSPINFNNYRVYLK